MCSRTVFVYRRRRGWHGGVSTNGVLQFDDNCSLEYRATRAASQITRKRAALTSMCGGETLPSTLVL